MRILPIASGKGGVGKSLLAANLSIALAQTGMRVVLIDLDLGASNIHQILGMSRIETGIGCFINDTKVNFQEIVVDSDIPNLSVVLGDTEIPGVANLAVPQKKRIMSGINRLETDIVVLDLGAGTTFNTIDFFLMSNSGIVVTAPALTASLNAYLFLKNVLFRLVTLSFSSKSPAAKHIKSLKKDTTTLQRLYLPTLLDKLKAADPTGYEQLEARYSRLNFYLVMNLLDNPKDTAKAEKIKHSCHSYLNLNLEHLGAIYRDHYQDIASRSRLPIILYKPNTILSQGIYRIAEKLMKFHDSDPAPIDLEDSDDSFDAAEMDAEVDFEAKLEEMQDLLQSGALSKGDLIETVKSQRYEINSLKKENQLLKRKLIKAVQAGFVD